jgi:transcriptional regulator with PAS, ATPase and Fis domain
MTDFITNGPNVFDRCPVETLNRTMLAMWALATRVAPTTSTVLITGESGVGKERVARWLHDASPRADRAFVAVNCAGLSESLLEDELFGHRRGAFTGATQDRVGVIEAAHRSTLFLDEIGDVSMSTQVRLLRVIQEHEMRRIGETTPRAVDFRLVTATNRDLRRAVDDGRFREDLYYRLSVITLVVPPLRERPEDVPILVEKLLPRVAMRVQRTILGVTPRGLERIRRHDWPGNVRELEHALEYACAAASGPRIDAEDLPPSLGVGARLPVKTLKAIQRDYMYMALQFHDQNFQRTAAELGISVKTLRRHLEAGRYLRGPRFDPPA